jgi:hypothetical protein
MATQTTDLEAGKPAPELVQARQTARRILIAFLFTFTAARLLALLIMARKIPDVFLYLGGTHVHHVNYGIFLLAAVGGYLLLKPAPNRPLACFLYGVGMGLTFDEFGMWLHLGGSYWQRPSWGAVAVVAASLGLFAYGPAFARYRPRHWASAALVLALIVTFFYFLPRSFEHAGRIVLPKLERIEQQGPR